MSYPHTPQLHDKDASRGRTRRRYTVNDVNFDDDSSGSERRVVPHNAVRPGDVVPTVSVVKEMLGYHCDGWHCYRMNSKNGPVVRRSLTAGDLFRYYGVVLEWSFS
jgi:hypothetical protein